MKRRTQQWLLGAYTRRMITIPVFVLTWLGGTLIFPIVVPGLAIADFFARRKLTVVRAFLMGYVFMTVEVITIGILAYFTLTRRRMTEDEWLRKHNWVSGWWARVQFDWARRIFRLKVEVEGEEVLAEAPFMLFVRHVSVIDNLIPATFAVDHHQVRLRWVLNWFLLRDPCIDIVGHRLGCSWIKGGTDSASREISRIRTMAQDLLPEEGIIIYPEGTLFSPEKRARVQEKLKRSRDMEYVAFASQLRNTLPPRLGGTIPLLDLRPDLDVVFCSHSGLENSLDKASIVAGGLNGQRLRIKFWRVKAGDIPRERSELRRWLFHEWTKVDQYVTAGTPGERC